MAKLKGVEKYEHISFPLTELGQILYRRWKESPATHQPT